MIGTQPNRFMFSTIVLISLPILMVIFLPGAFQTLLSSYGFIPHGHCFLWKPGLVWLHVSSDSLIALAYLAISATLVYFVHKTRKEIPFHWMFLGFGLFIIACGTTHIMDVWTLWNPMYWLSGTLKLLTAVASVTTALALPPLVPQALKLLETAQQSEQHRLHLETANKELEILYARLKELDQLKTQFFANVSHELRTPLALILAPTEKLLHRSDLNFEQQQDLEVIHRNARLLLKQVNDLLDVSKLEAGQMQVHYSQTDLVHLIQLITANFDGLAQERKINFTVEVPDQVPAQVDVEKIERILLNLLSNAFKFTPPEGRIRCILTTSEETPPQQATLIIQDSGIGVAPELRDVIFERFHQGEAGLTRRFGGTGLGLAIVKEFVEQQRGTIQVEDAPIGGAEFRVEIPLVAPPEFTVLTDTSPETEHLISAGNQERVQPWLDELRTSTEDSNVTISKPEKPLVLVVEDNSAMRQFVCNSLASEYNTAIATDGKEGCEQALLLRPDLIISDIMMPGMSGDQLVQEIRTHPELESLPILMLTAKADDEFRVKLLREGVQDYLMKPFSVEELLARVRNWVSLKRTRDLLQAELATQSLDLEALTQELTLRKRELQLALKGLRQQAEELTQANQLKNEFLAIVSHELRTPLNIILGWLHLLRTRNFPPERTKLALEIMDRNAKSLTKLIEDLLDISKLLQGKMTLNVCSVQLQPVIQSALETVEPLAVSKGIQLKSEIDELGASVMGDTERLQQIVENLLDNAIKFTPSGGQVTITLKSEQRQARIQVTDTGQGIHADVLPCIFDSFRQGDSKITREHGGLGLGLAIVQQLVELQKGTVTAESEGVGKGSRFTVTFPVKTTYPLVSSSNNR